MKCLKLKEFILTMGLLVFPIFASQAVADDLPAPTGPVVLTVSGAIANTNGDGAARLDRDMLRQLDWREIRTFTSFTDGEQMFEGPTLSSLLAYVGASGTMLNATAVNDYFVQIPVAHADDHDVILAMTQGGVEMSVRNKGPIWVVYPQSEKEAQLKQFDNEMIWQLVALDVGP